MSESTAPGRPRPLTSADWAAAFDAALAHLLTGADPFVADPFRDEPGLEVVGEEYDAWSDDFAERLRRSAGDDVLVLRLERTDQGGLRATDGWSVPLDGGGSWWESAADVGLTLNGLDSAVLDRGGTWVVLVVPDAQLVAGSPDFTGRYFGGEAAKADAAHAFVDLVGVPDAFTEFRRLASYLRFRVDGQEYRGGRLPA